MRDDFYQKIGKTFKNHRKAKHWSQEQVAKKAEISQGYMSEIEKGIVRMPLDTYMDLCSALGIAPQDMLEIKDYSIKPELLTSIAKMKKNEQEDLFKAYEVFIKHTNQ